MKKHRALIHSIVENAYLNGIVQNNVVVNIELPKIQKHESKALDEAELKHLIKKVENEPEPTKPNSNNIEYLHPFNHIR